MFTFELDASFELDVDQIWPDGDAPDNPTAQDVVRKIVESRYSVGEWLGEWNLSDFVVVYVDGVDVDF
jgi:hypothetical protein